MNADTRHLILDASETLLRSRGYSAFSYADLAKDLGITKASVHYHFATKEELVLAILQRCTATARTALAQIDGSHADARDRLRAYAGGFHASVARGMLPVCGALAAERVTLPPSTHPLIHDFFQLQIDWLVDVVRDGVAASVLAPPQPPEQAAIVLFSALEGGAMIGWGMDRTAMVLTAFEAILDCMQGPAAVGKQPQAQMDPSGSASRSAA